jgi:hypothetical protein
MHLFVRKRHCDETCMNQSKKAHKTPWWSKKCSYSWTRTRVHHPYTQILHAHAFTTRTLCGSSQRNHKHSIRSSDVCIQCMHVCIGQHSLHRGNHLQVVMGFVNGPVMTRPSFSRYLDALPISALNQISYTLQEMRFHVPSEHKIDGQG